MEPHHPLWKFPGRANIIVGNAGFTSAVVFNAWDGRQEYGVKVDDAIQVGRLQSFLCTVDALGHMRAFREGALIGKGGGWRSSIAIW